MLDYAGLGLKNIPYPLLFGAIYSGPSDIAWRLVSLRKDRFSKHTDFSVLGPLDTAGTIL